MGWMVQALKALIYFLLALPNLIKLLLQIGQWQKSNEYKSVTHDLNKLTNMVRSLDMKAAGVFTLLLSITEKMISKTPNYPQIKREQFFKLKTQFEEEITKNYTQRDDDLIMNLKDELERFVESFSKEI